MPDGIVRPVLPGGKVPVMHAITSAEFRSQNEILFTANILPDQELVTEPGVFDNHHKLGDVIDLNGNGRVDFEIETHRGGLLRGSLKQAAAKEPALAPGLQQLRQIGRWNATEVLTQDDCDLRIQTTAVTGWKHVVHSDLRPMASLLSELAHGSPDAKCAVDLARDQFLIYAPKATPPVP